MLVACGGGGTDASPADAVTAAPATVAAYAPDLRAFAVAWTSLQIAGTALDVLHISGETGSCGGGGTTRYDVGLRQQSLAQCITRTSPDANYTGNWSASVVPTGNTKSVTASSPSLGIIDPLAPTQPTIAISAGNVVGTDDFGNDTIDSYTGVGFSLDARIGNSGALFHIASNAAGTASQSVQNGVATLTISSASIGVNLGSGAWRFTVQNLRAVGDQRPDQGTLVVADQSLASTAATTVSFGAANALRFASGGQIIDKHWGDADVQAALLAARM